FIADENKNTSQQQALGAFVPSAAIRDADGNKYVFIAFQGKAMKKDVKILSQRSAGALVSGLNGGESVITTTPEGLKDGDKTKILNMIAAIDRPTAGEFLALGQNIFTFNDAQSAKWRNEHIGYVFQTFNLIPVLTAFENVELPLLLTKLNSKQRRDHVMTALKLVGLEERVHHLPKQLSGGQEQRVAIARAIVSDPTLLLADEPTGDLDSNSATEVLEIIKRLNEDFHKTIVMVTHDPHAASYAHVT